MGFRTLDAADFNSIANHPDVRPWLGHVDEKAPVDLSEMVCNPDNYAFMTPERDGGYILHKLQPGLYAAHTLAKPSGRGPAMLKLMHDGFSFMFSGTDCIEICTAIPDGADRAKAWSDRARFKDTFRRDGFFPLKGRKVGVQFRSLTYADWVMNSPHTVIEGEKFHELVEKFSHVDHDDDKTHDRYVGATIIGCRRGNVLKSVGLYNRYASIAGYRPADIVSLIPPVVDIGDVVMQITKEEIEVLSVKREALPIN